MKPICCILSIKTQRFLAPIPRAHPETNLGPTGGGNGLGVTLGVPNIRQGEKLYNPLQGETSTPTPRCHRRGEHRWGGLMFGLGIQYNELNPTSGLLSDKISSIILSIRCQHQRSSPSQACGSTPHRGILRLKHADPLHIEAFSSSSMRISSTSRESPEFSFSGMRNNLYSLSSSIGTFGSDDDRV